VRGREDEMERFTIAVANEVLEDLDRRLAATRWTDDFDNADWRYGADAAYLKELVAYWREDYDWRERERLMNGFAHFRTQVDGLPIHFIHERGKGPAPIPLIMSHGWPWSFWDFRKVIGPLTDPAAHGGDPRDAFDVVVPSLPGYAFSTPLRRTGINWWKTADLWVQLMDQLGYGRFGAQGGDWGSFISAQLGHKHPDRVLGVHIHTPSTLDFLTSGKFDKEDFTPEERPNLHWMAAFGQEETGYMALQKTKPQTPAVALNDSPAGLLAWIVEKRRRWSDCSGEVERRFTKDDLIDTVMLYWVTESFNTSARYYYEGYHDPWRPERDGLPVVQAPTAIALMPQELTRPARKWAERYYNLQRWTPMPAGGHFAVFEEPQAMVEDLRAFFRDKR
jgi:pimeloyl-ACP methyl ester carboxylesterase